MKKQTINNKKPLSNLIINKDVPGLEATRDNIYGHHISLMGVFPENGHGQPCLKLKSTRFVGPEVLTLSGFQCRHFVDQIPEEWKPIFFASLRLIKALNNQHDIFFLKRVNKH